MGKLHKGPLLLSYVSLYLLVMVVLTEIYQISSASQMDKTDTDRYSRGKRQLADFYLMGHKAQIAGKGTTKSMEFYRNLGKKWAGSPSLRGNDFILRPDVFKGENYIDPDKKRHW